MPREGSSKGYECNGIESMNETQSPVETSNGANSDEDVHEAPLIDFANEKKLAHVFSCFHLRCARSLGFEQPEQPILNVAANSATNVSLA